jgi:hypothetical protein
MKKFISGLILLFMGQPIISASIYYPRLFYHIATEQTFKAFKNKYNAKKFAEPKALSGILDQRHVDDQIAEIVNNACDKEWFPILIDDSKEISLHSVYLPWKIQIECGEGRFKKGTHHILFVFQNVKTLNDAYSMGGIIRVLFKKSCPEFIMRLDPTWISTFDFAIAFYYNFKETHLPEDYETFEKEISDVIQGINNGLEDEQKER